jgi:hypothetical protein
VAYTYDGGRRVERVETDASGTTTARTAYRYAAGAHPAEVVLVEHGDAGTKKTIRRYDKRARLIEWARYEGGELTDKSTYEFDADGRQTQCVSVHGKLTTAKRSIRRFNARGRVAELTSFERDGSTRTLLYAYEYDAHGNWTKKTISERAATDDADTAVPYCVVYRTIRYRAARSGATEGGGASAGGKTDR